MICACVENQGGTRNEPRKNVQQKADSFVAALVNTLAGGTAEEIAERNQCDALDVTSTMTTLPFKEMPPDVSAYFKDLMHTVKETSMDTRHDLNLAFPPCHVSSTDNPLMLTSRSPQAPVLYA